MAATVNKIIIAAAAITFAIGSAHASGQTQTTHLAKFTQDHANAIALGVSEVCHGSL